MTFRGRIENGAIVLEGAPELPEGASVTVDVESLENDRPLSPLLKYAGKAVGLPPDASINIDHYLYGHPKRDADVR